MNGRQPPLLAWRDPPHALRKGRAFLREVMTPAWKRHSGECATLLAKAQLRVSKGGGIG